MDDWIVILTAVTPREQGREVVGALRMLMSWSEAVLVREKLDHLRSWVLTIREHLYESLSCLAWDGGETEHWLVSRRPLLKLLLHCLSVQQLY